MTTIGDYVFLPWSEIFQNSSAW